MWSIATKQTQTHIHSLFDKIEMGVTPRGVKSVRPKRLLSFLWQWYDDEGENSVVATRLTWGVRWKPSINDSLSKDAPLVPVL